MYIVLMSLRIFGACNVNYRNFKSHIPFSYGSSFSCQRKNIFFGETSILHIKKKMAKMNLPGPNAGVYLWEVSRSTYDGDFSIIIICYYPEWKNWGRISFPKFFQRSYIFYLAARQLFITSIPKEEVVSSIKTITITNIYFPVDMYRQNIWPWGFLRSFN